MNPKVQMLKHIATKRVAKQHQHILQNWVKAKGTILVQCGEPLVEVAQQ